MFTEFTDTFIAADWKRLNLNITVRQRVGAELGHGDGPKYLVDVDHPEFPDPMIWKVIAPIDSRIGIMQELTPSRVVRKQKAFKNLGIPVVDQIYWNKSNSALLMSDLTQSGRIELLDFVAINDWLINDPQRGLKEVEMKAPWFLNNLEMILGNALAYSAQAASSGFSCNFDTFFALRHRESQEVGVVAGDLGHGVIKRDLPMHVFLEGNRTALLERFGSKLRLLDEVTYKRLESAVIDDFSFKQS